MSKLLQEKWLRLSGLLVEETEVTEYDQSKDTGGIEIVSELAFCVSLVNGGISVDEAQMNAKGQNLTQAGAWSQWQKYAPLMKNAKNESKGGNELARYLKVGSNMAQCAKDYIENTYSGTTSTTVGTSPTITGATHAGAVNNTGRGSGTEDVIVNFTDGDGKIQALGISLKAFERSSKSPGALTGQSLGLSDMFAQYFTTSSPELSSYLQDLKAESSSYTAINPFKIVTDWCWVKAGGDLRDAIKADFDNPNSPLRKNIPKGKNVKFSLTQSFPEDSDVPGAPSFTTQDTGEDFDLFDSSLMDDEVKSDLRSQLNTAADKRVPNPSNMRGRNTPREFTKATNPRNPNVGKERVTTGFADNDPILGKFPNKGLARRSGPNDGVPDRGILQNRIRVHLMEELSTLCNGAFAKSFASHCLRRSMGRPVISGNFDSAFVYVTDQAKYDRVETSLEQPDSAWTFEKKGDTGFIVKCQDVNQVSGNLKIDGGQTYGVGTAQSMIESKYSLSRFFGGFGTKYDAYSVSAQFKIV